VTETDGNGNDQTSGNGIFANVVNQIGGIGPDGSGNMWFTAGSGDNGLYEFANASFTGYASPSFSSANGLSNPNGVAVDHNGRIWVADEGTDPSTLSGNMDIFTGLSENGPITVTGMDAPVQVALDANGYAWFSNATGGPDNHTPTISVTDFNGTDLTTTAYGGAGGGGLHTGFSSGGQIAIDGLDNAWVMDFDSGASTGKYRMVDLSGSNSAVLGTPLTGTSGLQSSYLSAPQSFAIDSSGDIWISNQAASSGVDSLVEFLGVAGPVKTPQAVQIQNSLIGLEP
jgi:secreted PhoX family phosphatase